MLKTIKKEYERLHTEKVPIYKRAGKKFSEIKIATIATQVPPLTSTSIPDTQESTPALKWTGNAVDLVEIIYGISEMDCYRFYTDIKRRKSDSRTYFLDKMQVKLNKKMQRDDEPERMRR